MNIAVAAISVASECFMVVDKLPADFNRIIYTGV
jgi:hypothetical protein